MKKSQNPFEFNRVAKQLFAEFAPSGKDRRTRTFLRKMARHICAAYEIGRRDAAAEKPLVEAQPYLARVTDPLELDLDCRAYGAYKRGYADGQGGMC